MNSLLIWITIRLLIGLCYLQAKFKCAIFKINFKTNSKWRWFIVLDQPITDSFIMLHPTTYKTKIYKKIIDLIILNAIDYRKNSNLQLVTSPTAILYSLRNFSHTPYFNCATSNSSLNVHGGHPFPELAIDTRTIHQNKLHRFSRRPLNQRKTFSSEHTHTYSLSIPEDAYFSFPRVTRRRSLSWVKGYSLSLSLFIERCGASRIMAELRPIHLGVKGREALLPR